MTVDDMIMGIQDRASNKGMLSQSYEKNQVQKSGPTVKVARTKTDVTCQVCGEHIDVAMEPCSARPFQKWPRLSRRRGIHSKSIPGSMAEMILDFVIIVRSRDTPLTSVLTCTRSLCTAVTATKRVISRVQTNVPRWPPLPRMSNPIMFNSLKQI